MNAMPEVGEGRHVERSPPRGHTCFESIFPFSLWNAAVLCERRFGDLSGTCPETPMCLVRGPRVIVDY